jgi:hypothetical protein
VYYSVLQCTTVYYTHGFWAILRADAAAVVLAEPSVVVRWFWLLLSGLIALYIPKFGDYLGNHASM